MTYSIAGGPNAVVIGGPAGTRSSGGRWERSETEPLRQPEPFWGDPDEPPPAGTRAWLGRRADVARSTTPSSRPGSSYSIDPRTGRLLALRMTAESHFMRHRYTGFDKPFRIVAAARPSEPTQLKRRYRA